MNAAGSPSPDASRAASAPVRRGFGGLAPSQRWIAVGATLSVCGIGVSLAPLGGLGGLITLAGLGTMLVGVHRLGRSGAD